jgi:hypothetical protein
MSSLQTSFLNRNQIKYYYMYHIAGGFKIWYCYCVTLLNPQMLKVKSQTERISMWNREFNSILKKKNTFKIYIWICFHHFNKRKEKKRKEKNWFDIKVLFISIFLFNQLLWFFFIILNVCQVFLFNIHIVFNNSTFKGNLKYVLD